MASTVARYYTNAVDQTGLQESFIASQSFMKELNHRINNAYRVTTFDYSDALYSYNDHSNDGITALFVKDEGLVNTRFRHDVLWYEVIAATPANASILEAWVNATYPREPWPIAVPVPRNEIYCNFWRQTPRGPREITRSLDASYWDDVKDNYPETDQLDFLMHEFIPGQSGQLILWHGPPGTGKTTALKTLACEWRKWCSFSYIIDPDIFLGSDPDYMMQVIVENEEFEEETDDQRIPQAWRLIVLEDCGEMLSIDARHDVGQALARLLNLCDGLIGRGLRFLILMTTNESLQTFHPAVARPGRCASLVHFRPFTTEEAGEWMNARGLESDYTVVDKPCLADLYHEASKPLLECVA